MKVVREQVLKILPDLGQAEFGSPELAKALTKKLGVPVDRAVAHYWAEVLASQGVLIRRQVRLKLYAYQVVK